MSKYETSVFTIDNGIIVKKRRKKRLVLWKCRCATHSEVWIWRMHQCTFIEHSQFHHIRPLFYTMILASIIISYIFTWVKYLHAMISWHPSNNIFNTWQIFIWISILGSFFRVPEYRHWVENFPHCAKKVRPSGGLPYPWYECIYFQTAFLVKW